MRRLTPSAYLVALLVATAAPSSSAQADPAAHEACFLPPQAEHTVDPQGLLSALKIETRKAELSLSWRSIALAVDCPIAEPLLSFVAPNRIALVDGDTGFEFESRADGPDRDAAMMALARDIVDRLAAVRGIGSEDAEPLLDANAEIILGGSSGAPGSGDDGAPLGFWTHASAVYLHQFGADRHLGGVTIELGLALFEERLAFSVLGTYAGSSAQDRSGVLTGLTAGELLAMARGGAPVGPALLRGGVGAGWQRRSVSANTNGEQGRSVFADSDAVAIAADLETLWSFADVWRVVFRLNGRVYLGGKDHLWLGESLYGAPRAALGTEVGLGVTL